MKEEIRVLIADDHEIFRKGLQEILEEEEDILTAAQAENGEDAVDIALEVEPDVVLMDVHMPGKSGIDAVRQIKDKMETRILMLTVSEDNQDLQNALLAGADGYLLKDTDPHELCQAIRRVAAGESVLSPAVTGNVVEAAAHSWGHESEVALTPREKEVIVLLAEGATTKDIAEKLVISKNTVKSHVHHILNKLEAKNRAEAVARAAKLGFLKQS